MTQFEQFVKHIETADEGAFVFNPYNGRKVEVANMAGGRYLCTEHGEPCRQTDNIAIAFNFLMKGCK